MPLDVDPHSTLHGALDPTTGIFYRAAEHPRVRTAQACSKCRVRKAKCSGERPMCERCRIRGLVCQYPIQERTRRWSGATTGGGPSSRSTHAVHSENDQRLRHASSTVFDVLRDPEPRKCHIFVHVADHGAFEPTKDSITSEGCKGKGMSNEDDLPTFVVPRLLEGADASFITLADRDMARAALGAGCHKDVDGAWQPMSSFHPCNLHRITSCFDVSLVDPSVRSSYQRSMYCASNAGSPDLTTSPTTPINSYPSSLPSLPSLSPFLGPYASGIPPESHFERDIQMMEMLTDTDSMRSEHMGWDEVKDSPWDMELFLDLDVIC